MSLNPTSKGGGGRPIIRQSYIGLVATAFGASSLIFLATYGGNIVYAIQTSIELALVGIVFSMAFQLFAKESPLTQGKVVNVGLWSFFLLFGFVVSGYFIPFIKFPTASIVSIQTFYGNFQFDISDQSLVTGAFLFVGVLEPVSEEQFFRGFWGNFALATLPKNLVEFAPVLGGAIFAVFHFAVYGLNYYTLGILFFDGMIIMGVDAFATGDITPGIIAHILNNSLAFGIGGGILPAFIPGLPATVWLPVMFAVPIYFASVNLIRQIRAGRLVLFRHYGVNLR